MSGAAPHFGADASLGRAFCCPTAESKAFWKNSWKVGGSVGWFRQQGERGDHFGAIAAKILTLQLRPSDWIGLKRTLSLVRRRTDVKANTG
jgi:hypothetical protein